MENINGIKKRALVLSGGGAKGSFELGALEFIRSQMSDYFKFDIIAGVSVGSLNGSMIAQNKFKELQEVWENITNDKVYTGSISKLRVLWRTLWGKKAVLGIEPLIRQIHEHVDIKNVSIDFRMGFVSLVSGEYIACKHTDFNSDNQNFRNAILASCSMPIIWEPVEKIKVASNNYYQLVDGGVRNVSPLCDVLDDDPDEIIIINCSYKNIESESESNRNIVSIAKRCLLDITMNEIFRTDVDTFERINYIVSQCPNPIRKPNGIDKFYKRYKSIIIEPNQDLGDALDFSKEMIAYRKDAGYKAAEDAFNQATKQGMVNARSFR